MQVLELGGLVAYVIISVVQHGQRPFAHPRHLAALTGARAYAAVPILAGWYLMLLPNIGPRMATISPPVWSAVQHSYDTAKECERARAKARIPPQSSPFAGTDLAFYCIASDDPRLR
jgi:hypothetical protein